MKYLSLFSGYGGFELGIQQAYEKRNKNKNDTGKRQKTSEQQGVPISSDFGGFQREEVSTNGKCENTTQGGTDKFFKGNAKLDETFRYIDVSQERGGKKNEEGNNETGERLHSIPSETTLSTNNGNNELPNASIDEGQPHCVGFSEIDKYAIQVYKKHFNHKEYGDITKIEPATLPDFDLLVGGFPCQAFSIAGKRAGFEDTRGTLIYDVFRIIKEKHPKFVLLENVKGLLSHDSGRTFKTIITSLAELGYAVEWQVLNAKNFGVPQNRERVFIVGHLGGFGGRAIFPIRQDGESHNERESRSESKTKPASSITTKEGSRKENNFIVQLNNPTHSNNRVYGEDGISPTLNTMQGGNRQPIVAWGGTQEHQSPRVDGNSPCLTSAMGMGGGQTPIIKEDLKIRRLTPVECERLMGLPDGWTEYGTKEWVDVSDFENIEIPKELLIKISDTQRYKLCGNGVVVNVVKEIIKRLI